ncbi:MAG: radical SAM protein [Massiliimalia sp.]|jgi:putative pyruvate formate lyase activating enzyme
MNQKEQDFLKEHLTSCQLCPRRCGVNRMKGELGFCGAASEIRVGRAALHFWEEPCLSGDVGSGTVFFSHCTLGCVFCQNYAISTQHQGVEITVDRLSEIFLKLQEQNAWNINLVTPTHYVPQIVLAVKQARKRGLCIPVVYNTSGYETRETLKLLEGIVDIYLPDFKYGDPAWGQRYSHVKDYPEHALNAIEEMVRQVGTPVFDDSGKMLRGVIVRHLMLPGLVEDTKKVIRMIHERFGDQVYLSLMNQYTPLPHVKEDPQLSQKLDPLDYDDAVSYAVSIGVRNGFIQEEETAMESFIPSFQGEGVLPSQKGEDR